MYRSTPKNAHMSNCYFMLHIMSTKSSCLTKTHQPSILGLLGGLLPSSSSPGSGVKLVISELEPIEAVKQMHDQ